MFAYFKAWSCSERKAALWALHRWRSTLNDALRGFTFISKLQTLSCHPLIYSAPVESLTINIPVCLKCRMSFTPKCKIVDCKLQPLQKCVFKANRKVELLPLCSRKEMHPCWIPWFSFWEHSFPPFQQATTPWMFPSLCMSCISSMHLAKTHSAFFAFFSALRPVSIFIACNHFCFSFLPSHTAQALVELKPPSCMPGSFSFLAFCVRMKVSSHSLLLKVLFLHACMSIV